MQKYQPKSGYLVGAFQFDGANFPRELFELLGNTGAQIDMHRTDGDEPFSITITASDWRLDVNPWDYVVRFVDGYICAYPIEMFAATFTAVCEPELDKRSVAIKHEANMRAAEQKAKAALEAACLKNKESGAPICSRPVHGHESGGKSDSIEIFAGSLGNGGASHTYSVQWRNGVCFESAPLIRFQDGPIQENGINGLTNEVLLAIVADRLRCFQAGPYQARENAIALTHVEDALLRLHSRTRERQVRGVEGTSQK